MKLIYKWVNNEIDMEACYKIRYDVFTLEQNFDAEIDKDEYDKVSKHILVLDNDKPIATSRIFIKDNYYKAGRICVLKEYRNKNIGYNMMNKIIEFVRTTDIKLIKLSSQYHAYKFYEKCGFKTVGEPYLEEGEKHILMTKEIFHLNDCRNQLNEIDSKLMDIFKERMDIIQEVGLYKKANNIDIYDNNREQEIINALTSKIDPKYKVYYKQLIETILKVSKDYQQEIIDND